MLGHLLCTKTQFTLTVFINFFKIFQVKESVALDFILDVLTTVKAEKVSKLKFSDYSFLCSAFKLFGPLFISFFYTVTYFWSVIKIRDILILIRILGSVQ
jgi:hypothetical protein